MVPIWTVVLDRPETAVVWVIRAGGASRAPQFSQNTLSSGTLAPQFSQNLAMFRVPFPAVTHTRFRPESKSETKSNRRPVLIRRMSFPKSLAKEATVRSKTV